MEIEDLTSTGQVAAFGNDNSCHHLLQASERLALQSRSVRDPKSYFCWQHGMRICRGPQAFVSPADVTLLPETTPDIMWTALSGERCLFTAGGACGACASRGTTGLSL